MTNDSGTRDFEGATFVRTSFRGATLRHSDVSGVTMRSVDVDGLDIVTPEQLAEERDDPWGFDWHPTMGDCVRVILEEEWAHLRYVRRDLALLGRGGGRP